MADHLAETQEPVPFKASALAISLLAQGQIAQIWATGNSMRPFLRPGMVVRIVPVSDPAKLKVGDVAFVRCNGRLMLHRVVCVHPRVMTKGDSVPAFDPPVEEVYGSVIGQGGVTGWVIALLSRRLQPIQFGLLWLLRRLWPPKTDG